MSEPNGRITEPRRWKRYLRIFGASVERQVDDEVAFHLEMRVQDYVRRGLSPEHARAEATRRFGDVDRVRGEMRELGTQQEQAMTRARVFEETIQDIRFAVRTLLRQPVFTAVAAITLALGIGATSAIFSVVNAYLFRPFPSPVGDRLVVIAQTSRGSNLAGSLPYLNYLDLKAQTQAFEDVLAYSQEQVSLRAGGDETQERHFAAFASGNYFTMLVQRAQIGRLFTADDDRQRAPVVVISDRFWRIKYAASPTVIGQKVSLNGIPYTIIGVTTPGFHGTETLLDIELFAPVQTLPMLRPEAARTMERRDGGEFRVWGLLRQGVTVERARSAVDALAKRLDKEYAQLHVGLGFVIALEKHARPDIAIANMMPWIATVFMVLVSLVLLIACVNVANLMLARATARQAEIAVRTALGASRARLVRQLLTESVVIAIAGLVLGVVLARWVTGLLGTVRFATDAPIRFEVTPDWRVLAFTFVVSITAGVIAGLAPALQGTRGALASSIREGGRGGGAGVAKQRFRSSLIVAQIAVSLVLLICAGLFTRSVRHASSIELGFRQDHLLMLSTDVVFQRYDSLRARRFQQEILDRVRATPGVQSAAIAHGRPLGFSNSGRDVFFEEDVGTVEDQHTDVYFDIVSPDYFTTLGTTMVRGRDFTRFDTDSAPRVMIVSQAMADRFWPGKDAIGRRVRLTREGPFVEIVGIARDTKHVFISEPPRPFFYLPYSQAYESEFSVFIHTTGDPRALMSQARGVFTSLDNDLPIYDVKTMDEHLAGGISMLMMRMAATLAAAVGLLGLLQTVVGLYGVISFGVGQRTKEFGIRLALGAKTSDVIAGVLRQGLALTAIGVGIGLAIAFAVTRALAGLLFGVSSTDLLTFGGASLTLAVLALVSTYIPARRASRMEPTDALRREG